MSSKHLETLSATHASFLADYFLPTIPSLPITPTRAFQPTLHLTVLGAGGSLPTALVLAARAAFADLAVPATKALAAEDTAAEAAAGGDLAGIKGAIAAGKAGKGRARARARGADDWDIDGSTGVLAGREDLPVPVSLVLVPGSDVVFIDATPREEAACPQHIHALFRPDGRICGVRVEGDAGIDAARVRPLLEVSTEPTIFCYSSSHSSKQKPSRSSSRRRSTPTSPSHDADVVLYAFDLMLPGLGACSFVP
jgi:exosome complex component RRP42